MKILKVIVLVFFRFFLILFWWFCLDSEENENLPTNTVAKRKHEQLLAVENAFAESTIKAKRKFSPFLQF